MSRRSRPEITAATTPDGGLVLVAPNGTVLHGNHTAAAMWRALRSGADHDEAVTAVARQYRAPAAIVRSDLQRMLATLNAAGIEHAVTST